MSASIGRVGWLVVLAVAVGLGGPSAFGQGLYLSSGGPVNRGMGGASTAAPIDALGALYWNPATISGLERSELEFGLDLLMANHDVYSSVGGFSGSTEAEPGVVPIPNVGWVHHTRDPAVTVGLGVNAVAGFKTNLPVDPTNPVLAPAPMGLGRVASEATFLQLAPVVSLALTERLSVAAGPVITLGQLSLEPFVFDAANANGAYSPGRASRYHWGGGVQAGVYYIDPSAWHFGASIKSPAWMEEFEFYGQDAAGLPRTLHADIDLPMVLSLGTAFSGFENWLMALDVRFMDYENTGGFGDPATYRADASLTGLEWNSVFALGAGIQRRVTDRLYVRAGYSYNENPIDDSLAFFSVASPLVYEHTLSTGASLEVSETTAISVAYSYMVENDRRGPIILPGAGAIPGSSVINEMDAHFLSFGIVMRH